MTALDGRMQSFLMYTNALTLFAHTLPLSKLCPAVRFLAVRRASDGPARAHAINYHAASCSLTS